jgi:uncharacterized protein (TIGR04141 family)
MTRAESSSSAIQGAAVEKSSSKVSREKRSRKEKLSIYLVKEAFSDAANILKLEEIGQSVEINISPGSATLYVKRHIVHGPPVWTQIFTSHQPLPEDLFGSSNSVGAVLLIRDHGRIFVLTFGTGHHLLLADSFERDFGLRVTLNSVNPGKLRSLDKASYDHNPLNSRTQSSSEVNMVQLQIDFESDLIYAVTGVSNTSIFGMQVTGRDAFTIATETTISGIADILKETLNKYAKKLPTEFDWVDNIHRIRDSTDIAILELELDDALKNPSCHSLYLGEPEIVDWEAQAFYSFELRSTSAHEVVLHLDDFVAYLEKRDQALTVESLRSHTVYINNSDFQPIKSWSAYRCLYAELTIGDLQYVLRNGIWYEINKDFVATIDRYLTSLSLCPYHLPIYNHEREDMYNEHVVQSDNSFGLMDKTNVQIGGTFDKIEFCDLTKGSNDFIHVKYYRSSATLSHLFAQGFVAAQTFIADKDFRLKVNPKLPVQARLDDPAVRPNPSEYRLVYAIATTKTIPDELPFFSKVTLKQALRSLLALGFEVSLAKIEIDPVLFAMKKFKPRGR